MREKIKLFHTCTATRLCVIDTKELRDDDDEGEEMVGCGFQDGRNARVQISISICSLSVDRFAMKKERKKERERERERTL